MTTLCAALALATYAQVLDPAYQEWAKDKYDENDSEALNKGRSMACGLCNLALMAIKGQYQAHREGTLGKPFSEEDGMRRLEAACKHLSPSMARKMQSYEEDTLMICHRVVREHGPDMLDALSVGDDTELFCKEEAGLCPMGHDSMLRMAKAILKDDGGKGEEKGKRRKRRGRAGGAGGAAAAKSEL